MELLLDHRALLVLAVLAVPAARAVLAVPEDCLSCLCQAATGCDANRDCDGSTCGIFALSRQYWKDAGAPGGDFETCALDPACATQSVQAYMHKFSRDCDGDGAVGCDDFCRLHRLGREGCGGQLDAAFAGRLAACNTSIPLGHFYARSVARPARQGSQWRGGGGGLPQSSGRPGVSVNPSFSSSVTVAPTYQAGSYSQGGGGGGGYRAGGGGYQQGGGGGYQGGAGGYVSAGGGGYQGGRYGGYGYGYEEVAYGSHGYSGYRRQGGSSYGGGGGGGYRGALWGAGESGGYLSSGTSARAGGAASASRSRPVSAGCLSCICNALTGCDPRAGCSNGGCGPFKLSQAYWRDCDSPGSSYEYCTRDYGCSSSCARAYLTKYAQDCDGDGVIDCRDYARIHRLGGFGCHGQLDEPYRSQVESCAGY